MFHVAAVVSGQAEADFDPGMHVNLDAMRILLEQIRTAGRGIKLVTTVAVAILGDALPDVVSDTQFTGDPDLAVLVRVFADQDD